MTWRKYVPGMFPDNFCVNGEAVPIPVIVKFDTGKTDDDWILNGELMMYCEISCPPTVGRPVSWKYKYSKAEFLRLVEEQRRRRQ